MKLSEMLTAIREYPALKIQYEAMREQQASQERTAVQLSIAYNNLQIGNRQLSQKNKALETALVKLVPQLNSREHCRRFYKTVAPYLDPDGFVLYRSAAELTRFHISTEFATEDNQLSYISGVDFGHGLLKCGSTIVPFVDHFPKNGRLYQLMTTKLSERVEQAS